jgi:hypothetical protein
LLAWRKVFGTGLTIGSGASYRYRKDVAEASGFGGQAQVGFALGSR